MLTHCYNDTEQAADYPVNNGVELLVTGLGAI